MEAVHRYEGTVNQVMGDGIMALFGAPLAHEDHAVRACYAALRMQQRSGGTPRSCAARRGRRRADPRRPQLRRGGRARDRQRPAHGLHRGRARPRTWPRAWSSSRARARPCSRRDTLRAGRGLHRGEAARAGAGEGAAGAGGGVRAGAAPAPAHSRLAGRRRAGAHPVRGPRGRGGEPAPGDGRARAAGHGQVVARRRARPGWASRASSGSSPTRTARSGWLMLESRPVSYGKATAYLAGHRAAAGATSSSRAGTTRARIREKVTGKLLDARPERWAALPAVPRAARRADRGREWQALDPPQRRQRMLDAVKRLILRESQRQPVLLVVREPALGRLGDPGAPRQPGGEPAAGARCSLLVSYRPEYQHALGRAGPTTPRSGWSRCRRERRGAARGAARAPTRRCSRSSALLVERTEGNPFFLEESVRTLVETEVLAGDRGAYRLAQAARRAPGARHRAGGAGRPHRPAARRGQAPAAGRRGDRQGRAARAAAGDRRRAARRRLAQPRRAPGRRVPLRDAASSRAWSTPSATRSPTRSPTRACSRTGAAPSTRASWRRWSALRRPARRARRAPRPPRAAGRGVGQGGRRTCGRPAPRPRRAPPTARRCAFLEQALAALGHLPEARDDLRAGHRPAARPALAAAAARAARAGPDALAGSGGDGREARRRAAAGPRLHLPDQLPLPEGRARSRHRVRRALPAHRRRGRRRGRCRRSPGATWATAATPRASTIARTRSCARTWRRSSWCRATRPARPDRRLLRRPRAAGSPSRSPSWASSTRPRCRWTARSARARRAGTPTPRPSRGPWRVSPGCAAGSWSGRCPRCSAASTPAARRASTCGGRSRPPCSGSPSCCSGRVDEGLRLLEDGVSLTEELGVRAYLALWTANLGEGLAAARQLERGAHGGPAGPRAGPRATRSGATRRGRCA